MSKHPEQSASFSDSKQHLLMKDQWWCHRVWLECCIVLQYFHFISDIVLSSPTSQILRMLAMNLFYREAAMSACLQMLSDFGDSPSYPHKN